MIHFKLKNINKIVSFGPEGDQTMHWFALTDGEYWIEVGDVTLFEYTDEILNYWGGDYRYVTYPIIRFIEDFTALFFQITESIPDDLFEYIKSKELLNKIEAQSKMWMEERIDKADLDDKEITVEESIRWILNRTLYSPHLTGAPQIRFFRNKDKILIVWVANQLVENKIPVWTARTGQFEINFEDFIVQIEKFGKKFIEEMEKQVNRAMEKDWGPVTIDRKKLKEQQIEREGDFDYWIKILRQDVLHQKLLKSGAIPETNWGKVKESLDKLFYISPNKGQNGNGGESGEVIAGRVI